MRKLFTPEKPGRAKKRAASGGANSESGKEKT